MQTIVRLNVENVKRISAVEIKPDGSVVEICGRNAQGKSSLLDSIEMALTGGKSIPDRPIRDGEDKARIVLETQELRIERTFTPKGSYLKVEGKNGTTIKSPQEVLNKLCGARIVFDPLSFARMKPADQAETLRRMVGLDFSALDAQEKAAYEERTIINRQAKALEAQLNDGQDWESVPDQELSIAPVIEKQQAISKARDRRDEATRRVEAARSRVEMHLARIKEINRGIAESERQIQMLQEGIARAKASLADIHKAHDAAGLELMDAQADLDTIVIPDGSALADEMQKIEAVNHRVRAKQARMAMVRQYQDLQSKANELTKVIETLSKSRETQLKNAKFPVEGLSFSGNGVYFNGIPFDQCSSAEQLKISFAMGAAMAPELRIMLIREGSLLDADSMAQLAQMAADANIQVWVERVGDTGTGILIEDGQVANEPVAVVP